MEQLLIELSKLGIRLQLDKDELRINAPQGVLTDELRQSLRLHKEQIVQLLRSAQHAEHPLPQLAPDPDGRAQPFPLTDLQHAYWLGRDSTMEMGNVATHLYVELDCQALQMDRLNDALCRMIERHDMLRAVVDSDGMQRILQDVPRYNIAVNDVSTALPEIAEQAAEQAVMEARNALSHQVLKADRWPLFEVRATLLPSGRTRLHVSLDLLILDAWSIFLFFKEWHGLYAHPDFDPQPFEISFRDYVLAERTLQQSDAYRRAHAYWMERVETLPAAPELPLRPDLSARKSPRFSRREARLERTRWEKLRATALAHGLTPSGLLLACYSEVLARWSATPHFTLNVTVSNRLPMHEEVNQLLGDFTSLVMQEVDLRDRQLTFLERARRLQQQFLSDMDHREVSGVTVMREWAKRRGMGPGVTMPVVFSSGLIWSGGEEPGDLEQFGEKVYSISQTSQVWLDHHVMELNGDLAFVWDAADAVFEEGVLDAMFATYRNLIERLANDNTLWHDHDIVPLPDEMQRRRIEANATAAPLPERRLHAGFVEQALAHPDAIAILSPARTLTYRALLNESAAVADWLIQSGAATGHPVAIVMRKGWEQIVAVYGVLLAGAAYMPIDADLPAKRQLDLLRIGEVTHVLTQPDAIESRAELNTDEWRIHTVRANNEGAYDVHHARSLQGAPDELAYVIFTSGTTGIPKGVMIDHRGAMNTIQHINRLYQVGAQDRVLAVSSLSFDLSVYDIFGLLDVGGALVLPDYRKGHDPIHWRDLIVEHQVTLWNSAPQLMNMLMDSFFPGEEEEAPLRLALLSGDFIPLDLPDNIRTRYSQAEVVSLGGATEASIWSIYYPIHETMHEWASIPYGKPLPNQTVWVVDQTFRPCPDHVKGRIFIGGVGLALGYWRDAEKTAARFVTHPYTGERLYDTGDLGRYAADGNIVILGRDDGQIKIRGHRVELGEIEAVLRQHPMVKNAIAVAVKSGTNQQLGQQLAAYIEFAEFAESIKETIKEYAAERLPDYMAPKIIVELDRIPLSSNGKIDYKALPAIDSQTITASSTKVSPRNATEQAILDAWSRVIVGLDIGVTDNFFDLGGDSVLATQLVRELNTALSFELEMHELFENITIEALAELYQRRTTSTQQTTHAGNATMLADIDAVKNSFKNSFKNNFNTLHIGTEDNMPNMPITATTPRAVFVTGATGWIGAYLLPELLSATSATSATIYCLVRASDKHAARQRCIENMQQTGIDIPAEWLARIEPVCGDLSLPNLGLNTDAWTHLSESVDTIYHLGACVNVLADYATHSKINVAPLAAIVQLAAAHHVKPVFFTSPMTVCRRHVEDRLMVLTDERAHDNPDGLLTGYAQSKWAAEQILCAAAERGLPVRIYRTSHALPSTRNGAAKPNDTYSSVLKVACEAGVVPDWADSCLHGVPVDIFSRLLTEDSLNNNHGSNNYHGIVHIENRTPLSLRTLIGLLLENKGGVKAPLVPPDEWKQRCLEMADRLPPETSTLIKVLFTKRAMGTTMVSAVDNMFSHHAFDTHYFESKGKASRLIDLTPVKYWRTVSGTAGW